MPLYEYYCRTCNDSFTQLRPMSAAAEGSECELGHRAEKVLTAAVVAAAEGAPGLEGLDDAMPMGGGCACGRGSCGCGAGGLN